MKSIEVKTEDLIVPVIMAGGAGTRLWPLSRKDRPKQFQELMPGTTPFKETCKRVANDTRFTAPIILTAANYQAIVAEQLDEIGMQARLTIIEPIARNTGPAITAAAKAVAIECESQKVLVLPSDHLIKDIDAFIRAVDQAADLIDMADLIVTFGIEPTEAHTGYGYIRRGHALVSEHTHRISAFIEKPDTAGAERLLTDGEAVWNSGMFCFTARRLLSEMQVQMPTLTHHVSSAVEFGERTKKRLKLDETLFSMADDISIDYALMEKTTLGAVVSVDCGWSDIGGFAALWSEEEKDAQDNACIGPVVTEDVQQSYLRSNGRLVTVLGLSDVVVIDSDDALLVADKSRTQDIKAVLENVRQEGHAQGDAFTANDFAPSFRPWGSYQAIDRGAGYQVKHITVNPGGQLSLQYHHHRTEHWTIVGGQATVTLDDQVHTLNPNDSIYIPLGAIHRLENFGDEPVHMSEVQCGSYLGEDDIVRLEDVYGRSPELPQLSEQRIAAE